MSEPMSIKQAADQALEDWLAYKKERKQAYKPMGIRMLARKREQWGDQRFIAAVDHSIACNYLGLYEPPQSRRTDAARKSLLDMDPTGADG